MASKIDLVDWLYEALRSAGGRGQIPDLCKRIWAKHESDLKASGDLFYTWQYDVRWAAYQLRKQGKMKQAQVSPKGTWELT